MDGGMKQEQMERLKALAPEEFEREDASMAEVLGSMGQSLGQLGRAPGLGQALLALGTGSSQAVAANEAEQDRLARQHAQRQRAFDQMLAQKSNQLDQQILQGKRRQYQADRELEKLRQQQDNARAQMLNQMSQVQAQGDKIRITTPVQDDEGNFAGQLKTRVIDTSGPEARQRLDYLTGRIDEDTTSHGTVGSKNVNDEMKGLNPQEKQTHAVTAPLVDGRRLMVPGMEKRRQELNQKGEDMVRQRYGIEGDVPLGRAARTLDVSYEELQDQIEEQAWALHMQEFQSNRLYRAASLEATNIGPYVEQGREEHEHWKKQQGEG
jgi:multidrug efflux pump subunit AcrA (membrane-fusion protein)